VFINQLKNKIKLCQIISNFGRTAFLATFLITFLASLNTFAASNPQIFVVAKVDNHAITNVDLINRYNLVLKISKIKFANQQERQIVLNQILQKMIDEELQIKEALALEIIVDQKKLDQGVAEISKSWHQNPKQISGFLAKNSLSYDSFIKQMKAQLLWPEIVRKAVSPKIKISQSEINELLELRKINSEIDKFFLSEIFIPSDYKNQEDALDGKELAFKLFNELQNGKNFNNFVKQFSRSPTAEFNGEIGWVGKGDVDNKIYQAVSTTKVGDVTSPVLMRDGYYIFKVNQKNSFSTLTEQDLDQVRNVIFNKKLQLLAKGYLMNLHKNSYIEIDKKALSGL
jgi:peptidyl-prolyl cis-trans isomerase SurA